MKNGNGNIIETRLNMDLMDSLELNSNDCLDVKSSSSSHPLAHPRSFNDFRPYIKILTYLAIRRSRYEHSFRVYKRCIKRRKQFR